jgi:hypothetical protein
MTHSTKQSNRDLEFDRLRLHDAADPSDGVRLIKAFLGIKEPTWREKLIHLAEDLAKASSDHLGTAQFEENQKHAFGGFDVSPTAVEDIAPVPAERPEMARKSLPMSSAMVTGRPTNRPRTGKDS